MDIHTVLGTVATMLWRGLRGFISGLLILWLLGFYGMVGDVVGFERWLKEVEKSQRRGAGL